jgi:hypothetical protein
VREHWEIENGLHYRRDDTLKDDRCTLRRRQAAPAMAAFSNPVLGLLLPRGATNLPVARREFDAAPKAAAALILERPR